jgi:hypothetical protein
MPGKNRAISIVVTANLTDILTPHSPLNLFAVAGAQHRTYAVAQPVRARLARRPDDVVKGVDVTALAFDSLIL